MGSTVAVKVPQATGWAGAELVKRPGNVNNPRGVAKLYGGRHFVSPFVVRLPWECAEEGPKIFLPSFDGDVEACASGPDLAILALVRSCGSLRSSRT